nr:riboflavin kinase-like [Dasypus novemcinctus]
MRRCRTAASSTPRAADVAFPAAARSRPPAPLPLRFRRPETLPRSCPSPRGALPEPPGPLCPRPSGRAPTLSPLGPGGSGHRLDRDPAGGAAAGGALRYLPDFLRGWWGGAPSRLQAAGVRTVVVSLAAGIYYGRARGGSAIGHVHKMVVSTGWNPYYKNKEKSTKTQDMHAFKEDFHGEILNVAIVGYLRPEENVDLESLVSEVQGDIKEAKKRLELPEHLKLQEDNFFQVPKSKIMNGHC